MFKELLHDAWPLIEKIAPTIASAISTPFGGVATKFGVDLLGTSFGFDPANFAHVGDAILQDPNAANKMEQLEALFVQWFKNNPNRFTMPSKAQINITLEWSNATDKA